VSGAADPEGTLHEAAADGAAGEDAEDAGRQPALSAEDEAMLRDAARGFLAQSAPVEAFRRLRDEGIPWDRGLWREMAAMGWAGVLVPEARGGAWMGHRAAGVLAEEMGRTLAASPWLASAVIAATALGAGGRPERLGEIASGALTYGIAVDEGPHHDPEACATRAERAGNGFRVTGRKGFAADGSTADRLLVLARAEEGLTLLDLDAGRAGIERRRLDAIDARDHAEITLRDVEATGEDVVGEVGRGLDALAHGLRAGQAALAAEMTGIAGAAFGMTVGYLKERRQFGRPIGSFQALQHRAAALWCEIEVTASAVAHAGRMLDAAPEDAALAVSLAKARAGETARLAVAEGVQMHGGIGMTDDFDMGFFLKRARVAAQALGDTGHHAARVSALRGA
jgi:acyl-CoA dehydrogenase